MSDLQRITDEEQRRVLGESFRDVGRKEPDARPVGIDGTELLERAKQVLQSYHRDIQEKQLAQEKQPLRFFGLFKSKKGIPSAELHTLGSKLPRTPNKT